MAADIPLSDIIMFFFISPGSLVPNIKREDPSRSSSTLRLLDIVGDPILSDKKYIVRLLIYRLFHADSGDPKLYGEKPAPSGFAGTQSPDGAAASAALFAVSA